MKRGRGMRMREPGQILLEGIFWLVPLIRVKRSISIFAITVAFLFFTLAGYFVIVI